MRLKLLLSCAVLSNLLTAESLFGACYEALPCISKDLPNVVLEANASCFRLTRNSIELAREEMVTDPNLNLLKQLKEKLVQKNGFIFISVSRTDGTTYCLEFRDGKPVPLVATTGGKASKVGKIFVGSCLYELVQWGRETSRDIIQTGRETLRRAEIDVNRANPQQALRVESIKIHSENKN